jgi:two-component system, chemotaxis family, chemotaxis protein CheY
MLERVLIVDDSSAMRAFVRATLEAQGIARHVVEAASGFDALRVLPRERFDLAVVDINMPDIHGLEVIKLMRGSPQHRSVPVVVISSEASPRDRERGLALGADTWLAKPFTPEQLVETIRRVTAGRPAPEGGGSERP